MRIYALLSCTAVLLSACSYFDKAESIDVTKDPIPQTIDLMNKGELTFEPNTAEQVLEDSAVDVFEDSFGNVPARSNAYSSDPSVEVFPLDDDMRDLIAPRNRPAEAFGGPVSVAPVQQPPVEAPAQGAAAVYFAHGSSAIDGRTANILDVVRRDVGDRRLSVEGHASREANVADPVQRKILNLKMSMNRAFSVAHGLIQRGVPAESIRTVAWGETRPPVGGPDGVSESQAARRVEILAQ